MFKRQYFADKISTTKFSLQYYLCFIQEFRFFENKAAD